MQAKEKDMKVKFDPETGVTSLDPEASTDAFVGQFTGYTSGEQRDNLVSAVLEARKTGDLDAVRVLAREISATAVANHGVPGGGDGEEKE